LPVLLFGCDRSVFELSLGESPNRKGLDLSIEPSTATPKNGPSAEELLVARTTKCDTVAADFALVTTDGLAARVTPLVGAELAFSFLLACLPPSMPLTAAPVVRRGNNKAPSQMMNRTILFPCNLFM
jgi:hypothetical protein